MIEIDEQVYSANGGDDNNDEDVVVSDVAADRVTTKDLSDMDDLSQAKLS